MANDLVVWADKTLSPVVVANELAKFAIDQARKYQLIDEQILGYAVKVTRFVDGVMGANEFAVKPTGNIVYEFAAISNVIQFIAASLERNSPVGSSGDRHPGLYRSSHLLYADGVETPIDDPVTGASEYTFVNTLPYARKIENGQSSQAPDGVYELTAMQAARQYGGLAHIEFIDYVGVLGVMAQTPNAVYGQRTRKSHNTSANRYPAIRVTVK